MTLWKSRPRTDEAAVLLDVLDDLSPGVFIVAPDLTVRAANRAARDLLTEEDAIVFAGDRLRIGPNGRQEDFARAVSRAAAAPAPSGSWTYVGGVDRATHPPLHVYVRGVTAEHVVVYLIDPVVAPPPDPELLRRMYRFSPAEIRVVTELVQGHSVETIAEVLSLSVHTVRAHLKNLFAKTGVRKQGELIHLISASLGCLRIDPRNPSFGGCSNGPLRVDSEESSDSSGIA